MSELNRRDFMALSAAGVTAMAAASGTSAAQAPDTSGLIVCMHGITSSEFSFEDCMRGWAKAGIKAAEPDLAKAREHEQKYGKGSARKLMDDLGLVAYSSTNQLYWDEPNDRRATAIDDLRWKVEMAQSLGATRIVIPSTASADHKLGDYDQLYDILQQMGDIAKPHNVALMLEFTRVSKLVNNVRTSLDVVRKLNHPNIKFMIDLYHFWAGPSKFEDLDYIKPGEIHHVHFADMPRNPPVEVAEQKDRAFPGEGITPLQKILNKLVSLGYNRALSLELFDMTVRRTDPAVIAAKALTTITPFIKGVK